MRRSPMYKMGEPPKEENPETRDESAGGKGRRLFLYALGKDTGAFPLVKEGES